MKRHDPQTLDEPPAENRWAIYSASSKNRNVEASKENAVIKKDLFETFEEDLATVRETSSTTASDKARSSVPISNPVLSMPGNRNSNALAETASPQPSLSGPGAVLFEIVSSLAGGLEMIGTELTKKLPEIERGIANAQQEIPDAFHNTARDLLKMLAHPNQSQAWEINDTLTQASDQASHQNVPSASAEGLFKGFSDLIKDIGDVGKAVFAADGTKSPTQQLAASHAAPSSMDDTKKTFPKEPDRSQTISQDSVEIAVPSLKFSNVESRGTMFPSSHQGCAPNRVIGPDRAHEHCVTNKPFAPDNDNDNDKTANRTGQPALRSHFRLRGAQKATGVPQGLRSRSPSSAGRNALLNTKRSVNFVDGRGVADRQQALDVLKRHRSMGSFRGRPVKPFYETKRPTTIDRSIQRNPFDNADEQQKGAYETSRRPSMFKAGVPSTNSTIGPMDIPVVPSAILDQEDSDPDFSMRYPSLLSSNYPEQGHANKSRFDSTKSFLGDFNPESEIARYPTVSQLHHQALKAEDKCMNTNDLTSTRRIPPLLPPLKIPGSWPQAEAESSVGEESSGQFFERMTGRTSGGHISRSNTVTASNPAARLPGPFDPLSDLAHTIREQKRRKAKQEENAQPVGISRMKSETAPSSRRPYSETFTGAGRVPWESFEYFTRAGQSWEKAKEIQRAQKSHTSAPLNRSMREPSRWSTETFVDQPPTVELNMDEKTQARQSMQPVAQKDKYDICAERMKEMGYGVRDSAEKERLRVFAVAADGSVEAAIDILEEERQASKTLRNKI